MPDATEPPHRIWVGRADRDPVRLVPQHRPVWRNWQRTRLVIERLGVQVPPPALGSFTINALTRHHLARALMSGYEMLNRPENLRLPVAATRFVIRMRLGVVGWRRVRLALSCS